MDSAATQPAIAKLREWRAEPVTFVREVFHVEPDAWQVDFLEAFPKHQRLALKACKGPGKSAVLAWAGWNFLATRLHPKVLATSITGDNLRDGLWTEFAKWQQRNEFLKQKFTWSAERIVANDHPETWWASARTWPKGADASQQSNTLAGIHADYVLVLVDEAGGIPDGVVAAAEAALATGVETKLAIAGNPTHLEGPLYRACTRERALWFILEISSDPDDPKRTPRVSKQWAREQIEKYGRDSPWVLVNVFGQFPPASSNALLGVEEATAAARRTLMEPEYINEVKILGVDVARFGDDRTVLFLRQGRAVFQPKVFRNQTTTEVAGHVAVVMRKQKPDAVFIDQTGVGGGVVDQLKQLGYRVMGVDNASRSLEPTYDNRRAEMWWKMADWLKAGGTIPDDPELISELVAPTYWFTSKGKIRLESKDEMKLRGLQSPDKGDALALTFAAPVMPRALQDVAGAGGRTDNDYDPHEER